MDISLFSAFVGSLLLVVVVSVTSVYFLSPKYDPREPPVVSSLIPYVGHILGLLRYGQRYFEILSARNNLPIYTLQILDKRTYVVNSADMVTAVERNEKTISFFPFVSVVSPRIFDLAPDSHAMALIQYNMDGKIVGKEGKVGLVHETHRGMHREMAPGTNLDKMNKAMLSTLAPFLEEWAVEGGWEGDLYGWIRPRFTIASTESIYGERNPIKLQPELAEAFWDFEQDFTMILLGLFPKYTARKGFAGRRKLHKAINEYLDRGDHKYALGVLKARYDALIDNGGTTDDVARFEIGDLVGVLVNATPTFFWMLLTISSDAALLHDIRAEVSTAITTTTIQTQPSSSSSSTDDYGKSKTKRKHTLDITLLTPTTTPLLHSTYRELLRHRTQSSTSRWITQDTLLANRYLLKKDSVLLIPGALIHADPIWGPDRAEFNPRRFLPLPTTSASSPSNTPHEQHPSPSPSPSPSSPTQSTSTTSSKPHPGAYRAWGGGQTLCPGRFFATAEITSAVAMVLMRFDMAPVAPLHGNHKHEPGNCNGNGTENAKVDGEKNRKGEEKGQEWVFPTVGGNRLVSSIYPPRQDVRVRVWEREEGRGDEWAFGFAEGV